MKNLTISKDQAEILIVSSFPPSVCGIATYTRDLTRALQNRFSSSISIKICALESDEAKLLYSPDVKYILKTSSASEYEKIAATINSDHKIQIVVIQHEFGFFKGQEQAFLEFIYELTKPVVVVFHTVLPYPEEPFKLNVQHIAAACKSIVVMTKTSEQILQDTYNIPQQKISVIPHGTPLVPHLNKDLLLKKHGFKGRHIFGMIRSLHNEPMRKNLNMNTLQKIVPMAWENSAIAHALLFQQIGENKITLEYDLPEINLNHLKLLTTQTGLLRFSKINQPDPDSGYTLDDNARALVTMCMHYKLTEDDSDLYYIERYLHFIKRCLQPDGTYLNYLDHDNRFTPQNSLANLDNATGTAIWALGYLVSLMGLAPWEIISEAITIFGKSLVQIREVRSVRAMAFIIKGLYFYRQAVNSPKNLDLVRVFSDRMVRMYMQESSEKWEWFESRLTYANSVLPEAMLYAWLLTSDKEYKDIAISSFGFLLSRTFNEKGIKVETDQPSVGGEQPLDIAYTIMTLSKFYRVFGENKYKVKMNMAFDWFLGNNRLSNIVYNPCTGGCYDGLEEFHVNLNQGAESTLSYLMARLTIESFRNKENPVKTSVYMSSLVLKS